MARFGNFLDGVSNVTVEMVVIQVVTDVVAPPTTASVPGHQMPPKPLVLKIKIGEK